MGQSRRWLKLAVQAGRCVVLASIFVAALSGVPGNFHVDGDRLALERPVRVAPPAGTAARVAASPTPAATAPIVNTPRPTPAPPPTETPCQGSTCGGDEREPAVASAVVDELPPMDERTRARNQRRALITYNAMWEHFYIAEDGLYRDRYNYAGWPQYAFVWPLSQVLGFTSDMAVLPGAEPAYLFDTLAVFSTIELYWDTTGPVPAYASYLQPPWDEGSDRYYDDNVWLGLSLLRSYTITGHPLALERARLVFDYMVSGWDEDPSHPATGGISWIETNDEGRHTVSTAPAAELGLQLYMLTDDAQLRQYYLDWALRMYDWLNQYMQAPDGLYWDHVRADGSVDMGLYSYNQGAMIGTNVMLYQVTGETHYLDSAVRIADAAVKALSGEALYRQQVAFNALFFRDLLQLNELRPDARYLETILSYADYLWNNARDPRTGLFTTSAPLTLLDQAAMGGIYAMLAGYGLDGSTATRWTAP